MQVYFPGPRICVNLSEPAKRELITTVDRTDQAAKLENFFRRTEQLQRQMEWHEWLRTYPFMWWLTSNIGSVQLASFFVALLINLLIIFYAPFDHDSVSRPAFMTSLWSVQSS